MSSLKDALMKAGYKGSKSENERQQKLKKEKTKTEKHQEHRNYCEVCDTTQPDVERFKHKNPRIDAEWICVNCADKNEILDQFRLTNQSDFARTGRYRRYYGPMKDFSQEGRPPKQNFNRNERSGHGNNRYQGQNGNRSYNDRNDRNDRNNRKTNQSRGYRKNYNLDENGEKNFNR